MNLRHTCCSSSQHARGDESDRKCHRDKPHNQGNGEGGGTSDDGLLQQSRNVGKLGLYTVESHRCAAAMSEPKVFAVSSISVELKRAEETHVQVE